MQVLPPAPGPGPATGRSTGRASPRRCSRRRAAGRPAAGRRLLLLRQVQVVSPPANRCAASDGERGLLVRRWVQRTWPKPIHRPERCRALRHGSPAVDLDCFALKPGTSDGGRPRCVQFIRVCHQTASIRHWTGLTPTLPATVWESRPRMPQPCLIGSAGTSPPLVGKYEERKEHLIGQTATRHQGLTRAHPAHPKLPALRPAARLKTTRRGVAADVSGGFPGEFKHFLRLVTSAATF